MTTICMSLVAACTHEKEKVLPSIGLCETDTIEAVSFSHHIQPIFQQSCALSGCHNTDTRAGGLNLDSAYAYQNLQSTGSGYIDTLDPTGSLIYSQMRSVSKPMPPTGNLDTCISKLVLKWITQKAPNN